MFSKKYAFRALKENPNFFHEDGTITTAVFKDTHGLSLSYDGGRKNEEVIQDLKKIVSTDIVKVLRIEKRVAENNPDSTVDPIQIKDDPLQNNQYHCLAISSKGEVLLNKKQTKYLQSIVCVLLAN